MTLHTNTYYKHRWRAKNPASYAASRKKEADRLKNDPIARAKDAAIRAARQATPDGRVKLAERRIRWMNKDKEKYLAYHRMKNHEYPHCSAISKAKCRCKKYGMEFTLTQEWAVSRWTGCCELTGIPFVIGVGKPGIRSVSLDRIDPSKGYTQENCRFILWGLNRFKGADTDTDMREIAAAFLAVRN